MDLFENGFSEGSLLHPPPVENMMWPYNNDFHHALEQYSKKVERIILLMGDIFFRFGITNILGTFRETVDDDH
ncbi:hypothetical protein [Methanolacinia paynteri]|uniref:hypothetical protein n=1 Tax=Methanolacinia paynteri TaxID=230356 RepID=UPI0012F6ED64|nr:hypothetical protein [Methanolacinia paynteri]